MVKGDIGWVRGRFCVVGEGGGGAYFSNVSIPLLDSDSYFYGLFHQAGRYDYGGNLPCCGGRYFCC